MLAPALGSRALDRFGGRLGFIGLTVLYLLLIAACLGSLAREGELSFGRNPVANLLKTADGLAELPRRVVRQHTPRIPQR